MKSSAIGLAACLMLAAAAPSLAQTTTQPPAATPPPAASPSGQPMWYSHQADEMRASKLIGTKVVNTANETIGDINEIVLGKDGKVAAVIIAAQMSALRLFAVAAKRRQSLFSNVNATQWRRLSLGRGWIRWTNLDVPPPVDGSSPCEWSAAQR
jgi:sporulation protein YlmC with PRC-barrel domain